MEIKIILFISLLLYSIIVSQALSYIISLSGIQQQMDAATYISFRKATDKKYRARFKPVVYAALLFNMLLLVFSATHISGIVFIAGSIALLALIADVVLALKGNIPINNAINGWTANNYPDNWTEYRNQWFQVFRKRQALNITGFTSLLAAAVFS